MEIYDVTDKLMLFSSPITSRRLTAPTLQKQQGTAIIGLSMTAMPHLLAACSRRVLIDHLHPVPHIPPCGNLLYALHNAHMPVPAANLLLSSQKVLYVEVLRNLGDRPQDLPQAKRR